MTTNDSKSIKRREFLKYMGTVGAVAAVSPWLVACSSSASGPVTGAAESSAAAPAKNPMTVKFALSFTQEAMDLKEVGAWKFKELVESYSNGEVIVDIYPGEQLGAQREIQQKVQAGAIEFGHTSSGNLSQFIPELNLLDLPFLFPDPAKFKEFMEGPKFHEIFDEAYASKGFGNAWWVIDGPRVLGLNKKVDKIVKVPADIKNLKIRVTGSAMEQEAFKLAGASPVPVSWSECYTGMQQGVFDGLNVGIPALHVNGYYEVMKNVTELNFMYNSDLVMYSKKWFDGLNQDHKDLFTKAMDEAGKFTSERKLGAEEKIKKIWTEEKGITLYTPTAEERDLWIAAMGYQRSEYDEFAPQFGAEVAKQIFAVAESM